MHIGDARQGLLTSEETVILQWNTTNEHLTT
jgi:hypothetical protein